MERLEIQKHVERRPIIDNGNVVAVQNGAAWGDQLDRADPVMFRFQGILGSLDDLKLPEPGGQYKEYQQYGETKKIQPLLDKLPVGFLL